MKMKRRILSVLIAVCLVIGTMPPIAMTALAADGVPVLSDDGYYEIATADELYWFANEVNGGNTAINGRLVADIVVNENVLTANGELSGDGSNFRVWTPIGDGGNYYAGIFDGKNHTVSGLYFNDDTQDDVGLFGSANKGSAIKNVGVIDGYIKGRRHVGGVCGWSYGTIENCYNSIAVSGNQYVGGVCGDNLYGTITNCYNAGTVSGDFYVSGVSGSNDSGTITNCYNAGTVSGDFYVSGVCGSNDSGTITNCYNIGKVSGNNEVGGVSGVNFSGTITNCHNTGAVSGKLYVGGVCGYNNYATIENCYNTGAVSGDWYVGGVSGENYGTITNCYNIGTVGGEQYVGGVSGENSETITNCYYLNTAYNGGIGGTDVADSAEAKTAEQFKSGEVCYLLNSSTSEGTPAWRQNIENYVEPADASPVLNPTHAVVKFDGTSYYNACTPIKYENGFCTDCGQYQPAVLNADGVYEISNAGQLYWFAALVNGDNTHADFEAQNKCANAKLTADIVINKSVLTADGELNGDGSNFRVWTPIGSASNRYGGTFDGQNHTISGLYFNNDLQDGVGLFGFADIGSEIRNVGIIDDYIKGRDYVGSVCGYNFRTITDCYNTGAVSGNQYVGGVCGFNYNGYNGTIANCYNNGAVSGVWHVGGVGGYNSGTIENCYYLDTAYSGGINGADVAGSVEAKTAEQFALGEVCYLLNGSTSDGTPAWRQNIENYTEPADAYPVLDPTHAIVKFDGTSYYNDCTHTKYDNGFCTDCGQYQPAVPNADGVYEINNAGQLYWFAALVNGDKTHADFDAQNTAAKAKLTADIVINKNVLTADGELNGDGSDFRWWSPMGNLNHPYAGAFDGDGHTVSGLYFNDISNSYIGLFGITSIDSKIKNIGVIDSYIKGEYEAGGVCGYNYGIITNCYNAGAVSGCGSIAGVCGENYGTIENCYNKGTVIGTSGMFGGQPIGNCVGGVCGWNFGTIENCYNTGTIIAEHCVGGVCGQNGDSYFYDISGTITNCYNTGIVGSASPNSAGIGGVCGYNEKGTIANCYNTSAIRETGGSVGGVCGTNAGTAANCYNTGAVSGNYNVGGVFGYNGGTITNCYNTEAVSGQNGIGGVCGFNGDYDGNGTIANCYNIGAVSGESGIGGVCGENSAAITNCYYLEGSAIKEIGNGSGEATVKTAEEFASGEVCYLLNGDQSSIVFKLNIGTDGSPNFTGAQVYKVDKYECPNDTVAGVGYSNTNAPINSTEHPFDSNGFCTACDQYQPAVLNDDGVYEIGNAGQLYWCAALVNGDKTHADFDAPNLAAKAKLTADIVINKNVLTADGELSGDGSDFRVWTPIGNDANVYIGIFDGQNHTVSGLYFNDDTRDYAGLFGCINSGSEIKNVGVIDDYIKGNNYVGGVCGGNYGTITNCYNTGAVSGTGSYSSGVCGENYGTITNCYNTGEVSGNENIGGVCGYNYGTIENCYNTGAVSGDWYVGGVCGRLNSGTIENCYSTGAVSGDFDVGGVCGFNSRTIKNCYNTGKVSGTGDHIGGVCGLNYRTITNCYNIGVVSGDWYVGGVCGENCETIENCYNAGAVSGNWYVGGVCGDNEYGTITNCYYLEGSAAGGVGYGEGEATAKTAEQFASGEVCYLLNGDQANPVFKQTVGTDNFPSFTGSMLYAVTFTDYAGTNANAFVYGNEGGAVTIPSPYNSGYAFKNSTGSFVTPITVFGTENVTYTAIPAPTYTVMIPESVMLDETNIDDTSGDYVKTGFDVSAQAEWLAGNGKTLTVSVESANGYQMKASGTGTGIPYAYISGAATFTADNKTVLILTGDNETKTASGTIKVNKADVIYAGTFTDILTFTIALNENP